VCAIVASRWRIGDGRLRTETRGRTPGGSKLRPGAARTMHAGHVPNETQSLARCGAEVNPAGATPPSLLHNGGRGDSAPPPSGGGNEPLSSTIDSEIGGRGVSRAPPPDTTGAEKAGAVGCRASPLEAAGCRASPLPTMDARTEPPRRLEKIGGIREGKSTAATKSSGNEDAMASDDRAELRSMSGDVRRPGSQSRRATGSEIEFTAAPPP
jgi:hypothetical protein